MDAGDELAAVLHTLIFLVLGQQFGHPGGRLFFEAQILMQDAMNGPHANSMGDSKRFDTQAEILFNGGSDRSDKSSVSDSFLFIQVALVGGGFASLNFLDDRVNCHFLKRLVPKGSVHGFSNCVVVFTGPSEASNEVASSSHAAMWEEW